MYIWESLPNVTFRPLCDERERKTKINKSRSWHEMDGIMVHAKLSVVFLVTETHWKAEQHSTLRIKKRTQQKDRKIRISCENDSSPSFFPCSLEALVCTCMWPSIRAQGVLFLFLHSVVTSWPLCWSLPYLPDISVQMEECACVYRENTVTQCLWFFGYQQQVLAGCYYICSGNGYLKKALTNIIKPDLFHLPAFVHLTVILTSS